MRLKWPLNTLVSLRFCPNSVKPINSRSLYYWTENWQNRISKSLSNQNSIKYWINPYWQISGKFLRPFYWKTHRSKNHEYLQYHSVFFKKTGRELGRFTGKLIQSSIWEFWVVYHHLPIRVKSLKHWTRARETFWLQNFWRERVNEVR